MKAGAILVAASAVVAAFLWPRRAAAANALPGWPQLLPEPMLPPQGLRPKAYISSSERDRRFGPIAYYASPTYSNPEAITITNQFPTKLVKRNYPQLPGSPTIAIHRDAAEPLALVLEDLESDNELSLIRAYDGVYNPRLVRGSTSTLSSHAYATSIDLNARENPLGQPPTGDQSRLAQYFERRGWYWGDRFTRRDPMHFEWTGG